MSRSGQPPDLKKYMDKKLQSGRLWRAQGQEIAVETRRLDCSLSRRSVARAKIVKPVPNSFSVHKAMGGGKVKLNANRLVASTLRGFDQFMNLVIDNTMETSGNEKNNIGMVVIRGNSVVMIEALEPVSKT